MGLEEIIKNIEVDTKTKTKQIVDAANSEAKKIADQAEAEAKSYAQAANAKADNEAKQMLMRESSRASIEGRGIYQKAVNDYIKDAMQTLNGGLDSYLSGADYQKLLAKVASMAADELGQGCVLMVQKRDMQKLKAPGNAKVVESKESFLGGLRGLSSDGKRYVDYSLEKVIDSLSEGIAVKLLDLIK